MGTTNAGEGGPLPYKPFQEKQGNRPVVLQWGSRPVFIPYTPVGRYPLSRCSCCVRPVAKRSKERGKISILGVRGCRRKERHRLFDPLCFCAGAALRGVGRTHHLCPHRYPPSFPARPSQFHKLSVSYPEKIGSFCIDKTSFSGYNTIIVSFTFYSL